MKAYVLVDDLVKELNQTYKGEMTDICLMPLGVENWLQRELYRRKSLKKCARLYPLYQLVWNAMRHPSRMKLVHYGSRWKALQSSGICCYASLRRIPG